jgi:glyoxylase-like metal-dependent hydrolase (beta-lactamase superfamily II)
MSIGTGKREMGRGERVIPGLWRLRLPLPWPGIPHVNAWAIADGDGIILVDCGMHLAAADGQPDSLSQLEHAMAQVGLRLDQVKQLVITHAHTDHWGQAATVIGRSGCQMWMHPNHEHAITERDPDSMASHWGEIARQNGIPAKLFDAYVSRARKSPTGIALVVKPDRDLVDGVTLSSDLGDWQVHETPGHAPSHVCLFQPEHRVMISGDHLLGRISLYYDYGWSPDPVQEFLDSLKRVDALDARLCVSGHGRPFTDVRAHVAATSARVRERLDMITNALGDGPQTAAELISAIHNLPLDTTSPMFLSETLCMLTHLGRTGRVVHAQEGDLELWRMG